MESQREKSVIKTSIVSILLNITLATFKAIVGLLANSIAIVSDAINNLSDVLSSIITIIGTKLAGKAPDKEHPYGHGRMEYMTSFIVSAVVIYAGFTALIESVKKIFNPEDVNYSIITLIIVIVSIFVKLFMSVYIKKRGKKYNSDSLVASGTDAFNDAILSTAVLISTVIYMIFNISIEAYVGALVSLYILKSGVGLIKESVDNILEIRVESELAKKIKKEVMNDKNVYGAFDLILNNYGPNKYIGSIHIEVLDTLSVAEIDKISRNITKNVMDKYGVILHTIGIYSINTKDEKIKIIRDDIKNIVFSHSEIIQMHGFYVDEQEKSIYFDIILDFKTKDKEEVINKIYEEIQEKYGDYKINIMVDIDVSD